MVVMRCGRGDIGAIADGSLDQYVHQRERRYLGFADAYPHQVDIGFQVIHGQFAQVIFLLADTANGQQLFLPLCCFWY